MFTSVKQTFDLFSCIYLPLKSILPSPSTSTSLIISSTRANQIRITAFETNRIKNRRASFEIAYLLSSSDKSSPKHWSTALRSDALMYPLLCLSNTCNNIRYCHFSTLHIIRCGCICIYIVIVAAHIFSLSISLSKCK